MLYVKSDQSGIVSTWAERELPILIAALRRSDFGDQFPSLADIRNEVGLDVAQMRIGLAALEEASPPYLTYETEAAGPNNVFGYVTSIGERARRELGSWPSSSSVVDDLVEALDSQAEAAQDNQEKSRLKTAAQVLSGVRKDVAVAVIAAKVGSV